MLHRTIRFFAPAAAVALCIAPFAQAQLGSTYEGHLAIQSRNAGELNFRGLAMTNDVIGGQYGLHPIEGPHIIAGDPAFYSAHQTKLTADINASIPDKNFAGIIVFDYENWWPNWEWSSRVTPEWTKYIKNQRPELLAGHVTSEWDGIIQAAYNAEVRKYYEFTINLCRQLRPRARISVYGIPLGSYWVFNGSTQGTVDLARYKQIHEVDLAWYFNLIDVVCPTIYQAYAVKTPPGPGQFEPAGPTAHVLGIVGEAVAAGRGKPVFPFMQFRYHPSSNFGGQFMTSESLDICIRLPRQAGAAGIIVWDFFYNDADVAHWQTFYDNTARSILATSLSNGNTGGPGGTGGTDPGPGPGPGPDPGTNPGGGTDPGTNPGGGTDPGTNPGGGGGPDPDPFGGGTNPTSPEHPDTGGGTHENPATTEAAASSGGGSSGGGGGGGSSGGGGGSSGGGGGGGSSGGGGLSMDGGGGGGGGSSGGEAISVTGAGLPGGGGQPAAPAPVSSAALAGLDPKFFRTFRGNAKGKYVPFSQKELALALARAQNGQKVDGAIKNPKVKLPESAVAGVPTE